MAVFAHKIHLPNRILHQAEKDNQSRDWFWLKGYEIDPLKKGNHVHRNRKMEYTNEESRIMAQEAMS